MTASDWIGWLLTIAGGVMVGYSVGYAVCMSRQKKEE